MAEKTFEKNKVTVVIPAFNEEHCLYATLESVVEQVDCVIIGDNASTDGTEKICREFAEKYPHVQYFRNECNIGSIRNIVLCYERVNTEFVFHMGAHDLLPKGYVQELKTTLKQHPDAICCYADAIDFDNEGNTIRHTFRHVEKFKETSQNSNPFIRGHAYIVHKFHWIPIYGLFRSDVFLPIAANFQPISNCDAAILFEAILYGTFIHSENTVYKRRDIHKKIVGNEFYDDAMKRVCGEQEKPTHRIEDMRPFIKQVCLAIQKRNCPEFSDTKDKFTLKIRILFCLFSGETTGSFWHDIIPRTKFFWKRSTIRMFWKKLCVSVKIRLFPTYARRKKITTH